MFDSNVVLTLKIIKFENVFFKKVIHICVIYNVNAIYTNDIVCK